MNLPTTLASCDAAEAGSRQAQTAAAFRRMTPREWNSAVMYFREQLVRDQRLLLEILRDQARRAADAMQTTECEEFVNLLHLLGLTISIDGSAQEDSP